MKVSIDTFVLLDLLLDQNQESVGKLRKHNVNRDILVICGMVYGEICPVFAQNRLAVDTFLSDLDIRVEMCNQKDYAYAGEKWMEYCQRRRFVCPICGRSIKLGCPRCGAATHFRQHILSDFVIGAFSELHCDGLLTRDYGYYMTYFPSLKRL